MPFSVDLELGGDGDQSRYACSRQRLQPAGRLLLRRRHRLLLTLHEGTETAGEGGQSLQSASVCGVGGVGVDGVGGGTCGSGRVATTLACRAACGGAGGGGGGGRGRAVDGRHVREGGVCSPSCPGTLGQGPAGWAGGQDGRGREGEGMDRGTVSGGSVAEWLHRAAADGDVKRVARLLDGEGWRLWVTDEKRRSVLHVAAQSGQR
jgi:hypothetical protein